MLRGLLDLLCGFFFMDPVNTEDALLITLLVALVATVRMAALARGVKKDVGVYTKRTDIVSEQRCSANSKPLVRATVE